LEQAWEGDPLSAFGSVLAFTRALDLKSAEPLVSGNRFVEAIVAPGFDDEAQVGQERAPARDRQLLRPPPRCARRRAQEARRRLPSAGSRPSRGRRGR